MGVKDYKDRKDLEVIHGQNMSQEWVQQTPNPWTTRRFQVTRRILLHHHHQQQQQQP
jgi:hypothetical protein